MIEGERLAEELYRGKDLAAAREIYSDEAFGEAFGEVQKDLREAHAEALEKGEIVTPLAIIHCITSEGSSGFLSFPMPLDLNDQEVARDTARSIGELAYQGGYAPFSWFLACRALEPDQLVVQGHAIGGRVREAVAAISPGAQFYEVNGPQPFGFLQEIFFSYVSARALDVFGPDPSEQWAELKKTLLHRYGPHMSTGKLDG